MPDTKKSKNQHDLKKLYRSGSDRVLGGIAGGMGEFFGIDPNIVRLIFILLTIFGGSGVIIYIILWMIIPVSGDTKATKTSINLNTEEIRSRARDFATRVKSEYKEDNSKFWWGVFIIVVGILFLFNNLGIFHLFDTFWPVILIMLGIWVILK